MPRFPSRVLTCLVASGVLLAGCTSGSNSAPSAAPSTSVVTSTAAASAAPTPVAGGPTTAAAATFCPLVTQAYVHQTLGVRLGRLTVLRANGKVVGCRFYAQQHPNSQCDATCLAGENLPGPNQPAVEITTRSYASSVDAHNAFVLQARTAPSLTQNDFGGVTGLCFQTAFDPQDKGTDYACTVNKGAVLVLVRTVDTTTANNTAAVLTKVLGAVAA